MFLPSLISAGALALSVDAFLVPFGSNNVQADDFSIYEGPHEVSVDCVSCPFGLPSSQDGQVEWKQGVPSDLDMLFNVEKNLVTFNGVAVYPLPNPSLVPLLTVTQRPKNGIEGANEEVPHDLKLSYSLEVIPRPAQDGNTLLTLTLGPMALENEMIRVDDVEVQIIRDANGKVRGQRQHLSHELHANTKLIAYHSFGQNSHTRTK